MLKDRQGFFLEAFPSSQYRRGNKVEHGSVIELTIQRSQFRKNCDIDGMLRAEYQRKWS